MKKHCTYLFILIFLLPTAALMGQESSFGNDEFTSTSPIFPYWMNSPEMSIRNPGWQGSIDIASIPPGNGLDLGGIYQQFVFNVQYSVKKFRVGLRLPVRFRLGLGSSPSVDFDTSPWIPDDVYHGLELYLSMLDIAYGHADDPLHLQFGTLKGVRLGNGAIVNRYTNTHYLPTVMIPGLAFTLDPIAWDFPYVGIQGFFGNVGRADLMGGRVFFRPLASLKRTPSAFAEIGGTFVIDRIPFYDIMLTSRQAGGDIQSSSTYNTIREILELDTVSTVMLFGGDIRVPVAAKEMFSMDLHADYIYQRGNHGARAGFDMRIIRMLYTSLTVAYTQENVQFGYIGESYDTIRTNRYLTYMGRVEKPEGMEWATQIGIFVFDEKLSFEIHSAGPLYTDAPFSMRAQFSLREGLISFMKGLSMALYYEKLAFNSFSDFAELKDSTIGGEIGLRIRPAILRCSIKVLNSTYADEGWKLGSDIGVTISF